MPTWSCQCLAARQVAMVISGRGDFQCAPGLGLAAHIGKIRIAVGSSASGVAIGGRQIGGATQKCADFQQRRCAVASSIRRQRRFRTVFARHNQRTSGPCGLERSGQNAGDRAQFAGQRQFAQKLILVQTVFRQCPCAARIPSAIGRSKRPPSLGKSAGARLTVTRRDGYSSCAFWIATRTRSRASFTAVSGRPTIDVPGKPPDRCTSTVTGGAATPSCARLWTMARLMTSNHPHKISANGRATRRRNPARALSAEGQTAGNGGP